MNIKEQIRAEIDKRYAEYRAKMKTDDFTYYEGMADALDLFEQYIDTFPEQPEVDLEKEVEKYLLDNADFVTKSTSKEMVNTLARHFAEWGRKQVLQEIYEGKVKPVDKITAAWLDDE